MTKKSFEFSRSFVRFVDFKSSAAVLLVSKVAKSGALAPKWRFWNFLWRQKKFGALRRIKKSLQKEIF